MATEIKFPEVLDLDNWMLEKALVDCIGNDESNLIVEDEKLTPAQEAFQKYFQDALKEFDVESPAELSEEQRKEFFLKIKKGWDKGEGKPKENK